MKARVTAILLLCLGCAQPPAEYVVRVGERTLTKAMLDSALASGLYQGEAGKQAYIQDWVNGEVLYQKAVKEGLDRNPLVIGQIERIRKEILVQFYVDLEMERLLNLSVQEMEAHYDSNRMQYTYGEDHVKAEYFLTPDMNKAKTLTREFARMSRLRKKDFIEIVTPYSGESDIIGVTEFAPRAHFEDRVAKQIFLKNATDDIIGPLAMKSGVQSFWHVVEIRPKGHAIPFAEVSHEIETRMRAIKRRELTESLIRKLRELTPIDYAAPGAAP